MTDVLTKCQLAGLRLKKALDELERVIESWPRTPQFAKTLEMVTEDRRHELDKIWDHYA